MTCPYSISLHRFVLALRARLRVSAAAYRFYQQSSCARAEQGYTVYEINDSCQNIMIKIVASGMRFHFIWDIIPAHNSLKKQSELYFYIFSFDLQFTFTVYVCSLHLQFTFAVYIWLRLISSQLFVIMLLLLHSICFCNCSITRLTYDVSPQLID